MSEEFKTAIEHVLSYVIAMDDEPSDVLRSIKVVKVADVNMGFFSGLEPLHHQLLAAMPPALLERALISTNSFRTHPAEARRVAPSLDISMIVDATDHDGARAADIRFSLSRTRVVPPSVLRGRIKGASDLNLELTSALVKRDLTYVTTRTYLAKMGSEFRALEYTDARISHLPLDAKRNVEACANMTVGIAVARYYTWGVRFGFPGSPSIHLMTDPTGACELLKLRDVSKGKRRDALVHWVSEHWRKNRKNPDALIRVKPHLRGKTHFSWDGLLCQVLPSAADIEANARGEGPAEAPWDRAAPDGAP